MPLNVSIHQLRTSLPRSKHDQTKPPGFRILYARGSRRSCDLSLWPLVEYGAVVSSTRSMAALTPSLLATVKVDRGSKAYGTLAPGHSLTGSCSTVSKVMWPL